MKKIQLAAVLAAAGMMLGSAYAAGLDAPVPPSINDAPDNIQRPSKSGETVEEKVTDLNMKNPDIVNSKAGKRDMKAEEAQSKKDLEAAQKRSDNPSLWPKTKIEETVDNHNQVTEVKVTPMSTQVPYVMTREAPSNKTGGSGPGTGSDNTMSVPKFINFGFYSEDQNTKWRYLLRFLMLSSMNCCLITTSGRLVP